MKERDCTLQDYLKLYNSAIPLSKLDSGKLGANKEFIAYSSKERGFPVALCSYTSSFDLIPYDPAMFKFYENYKLFWLIPLEIPTGEIVGFIIRAFKDKTYRTVTFSEYSIFYGLRNFEDFALDSPVILTEGTRDAMFLQKYVHPFSLSVNMGQLSVDMLEIITKLSYNFLILMDSDEAGLRNTEAVIQKFQNDYRCRALTFKYFLKDVGDYFYADQFTRDQFIRQCKFWLGRLG
jgi:hypothetical protein